MTKVPTLHIPMKKEYIEAALSNSELTVQNKGKDNLQYFYTI